MEAEQNDLEKTPSGGELAEGEGQKNGSPEPHHNTWMEELKSRIDVDFPLSGGETEADFERDGDDGGDVTKEEHLNTNFPLSGGD